MGKRLTVVTRFQESTSNAAWDLDKIPDIGWNLIIEESDSIAEISSRLGAQGTVVCIENLDRVIGSLDEAKAKKKFYKTAEKVEKHLALILRKMALLFASMEQRFNHGTRSLSIIMPLKSLQMKLYGQTMVHLKL